MRNQVRSERRIEGEVIRDAVMDEQIFRFLADSPRSGKRTFENA